MAHGQVRDQDTERVFCHPHRRWEWNCLLCEGQDITNDHRCEDGEEVEH